MMWQPPGLLSGRQRSGRLGVCCSACTAVAKRRQQLSPTPSTQPHPVVTAWAATVII